MEAIGSATGRYDVYVLRDPRCPRGWTQLDGIHVRTDSWRIKRSQVAGILAAAGSVDHRGADGGGVGDGEGSIEGKIARTVSNKWRVAWVGATNPDNAPFVADSSGNLS